MFYQMNWDTYANEEMANTLTSPSVGVPWSMGVLYENAVPQPIVLPLNPERGRVMPDMFLIDIPLFSDKMLAALAKAGIDNLQLYDAEVHSPDGNVFDNYKAVNIVGKLVCADLDKSQYDPEDEPPFIDFDHLVIDKEKAHGFQFFRLAEDCSRIIISEHVKNELEAANLIGVKITPIES